VFADLRPYICIIEDCDITTAFGSQMEYEQHLATHEFVDVLVCPLCNHTEQDMHHLQRHFRSTHPSETIPSVIKPKRVSRDLDNQACPFCGDAPGAKSFVRHVSRHCEEVALSSLSQTFDEDSDEGEPSERSPLDWSTDIPDASQEEHLLAMPEDDYRLYMERLIMRKQISLDDTRKAVDYFDETNNLASFRNTKLDEIEKSSDLAMWYRIHDRLDTNRAEMRATDDQSRGPLDQQMN
jgi:hypothetical protein